MKIKVLVIVLVLSALSVTDGMPSESTTARSAAQIGETLKQLTNQLMNVNATSPDIVTLDTRTPPKIKQHAKNKVQVQQQQQQQKQQQQDNYENSHAGVAIPVSEEEVVMEETTKKLNFYKIERPTTNSGLSTWILLSGQSTPTAKPSRKPVVKPNEYSQNSTLVEPNKVIKPLFKKRTTTTRKPFSPKSTRSSSTTIATPTSIVSATTTSHTSTITTTPKPKESPTKLTKVKASVLNNAVKKSQSTVPPPHGKKSTTPPTSLSTSSTPPLVKVTTDANQFELVKNTTEISTPEAKEGDTDLTKLDEKKKNKTKRKKNKNRRRRPTEKNDTNITTNKVEKNKIKEKPIGTQLYNYLSREVMPTVGVGLVGLMAAAGLASYFLYPFGAARRSYEIDRRDKEGDFYYNDEYSGGIAEEEVIGKVIAGMPTNTLYSNNYKAPSSRNNFVGGRPQQQVEHRILQGSVENVDYNPNNYEYKPITYNKEVMDQNQYTTEQTFVVGNIPTEEATPVSVPEHGPRSLRIRRQVPEVDYNQNEIGSDSQLPTEDSTTISPTNENSTNQVVENSNSQDKPNTEEESQNSGLFILLSDLFRLKVQLGLQFLQSASQSVSRYVSNLQRRFDEHLNNSTYTRH